MEMVHPYSNFYNSYGNFNHQNHDKSYHSHNYQNNRLFKSNKNFEPNLPFSDLVNKNNFNKHESSNQDFDKHEQIEFKSGMQDVPAWLKSLRLHKYKLIFSELSYEEMLSLTEQQLEEKNVTKGARHKIIVNIDKLKSRQSNIISMEKTVEHEGVSGIRQCLNELKVMLLTPIKAFESERKIGDLNSQEVAEGDLPSEIMKLLEKVFTCFQSDSMRDDEVINLYLSICEKVLGHEAFTVFHKQRLLKIKSKLEPFRYSNQQMKNGGLDNQQIKMKQWNGNNMTNKSMPLNHLQNLSQFKNISNNNLQNGIYQNGFNNQYNSNSSLNNQPHYHHSYQNNSNYNSLNNSQPQLNFFSKANQLTKQNSSLNLVSSNQSNNYHNNQKMNNYNNLNMQNEPHKFNVNAECFNSFNSAKPKQFVDGKNLGNGNNFKLFNENGRKLSGNRFMLGADKLNKYQEVIDEYERQNNLNQKNDTNGSNAKNKIISPLSSCSLFNACSQIGKFSKLNNQLNSFDKLNNLDSNYLKPNNQFIFGNLFNDSNLMKCLENNSSLVNSNVFSHEKLESNYETDDFDDKDLLLDENHQIYNHIELLSLRMTEQALGSSEFS